MVYLDYAASHPLLPEAREAALNAWKNPANNQASHSQGLKAANYIYQLEQDVADYYSAKYGTQLRAEQVIITTSGSRANNLIVETVCLSYKNKVPIIVPFFAHPSANHVRFKAETIPLNRLSFYSDYKTTKATDAKLTEVEALYMHTSVTSIDGVNIPTPKCKGWTHIDDTQGFLKSHNELGLDWNSVSLSFHKIGGPQGLGALVIRDSKFADNARRAYNTYTQNSAMCASALAAIRTFGKYQTDEMEETYNTWYLKFYAAESDNNPNWRILSNRIQAGSNTTVLLAVRRPRKATPGINQAIQYLDKKGIMVSGGTACTTTIPDDIIEFFQIDRFREDLVRVSYGCFTTEAEIDTLINILNSMEIT